jgi:hypothetical protein
MTAFRSLDHEVSQFTQSCDIKRGTLFSPPDVMAETQGFNTLNDVSSQILATQLNSTKNSPTDKKNHSFIKFQASMSRTQVEI